jgi:membrane protein DedA with SNARE-associated domain
MLQWIEETINNLGYIGILLLMALENVFPPIPSELIMPLAGFTASRGELSFIGVILAGTAGSVIGAIPLYFLGKWIGVERLKDWSDRHGKWILLSKKDIERVDAWFDQRGHIAVLVCRVIPGIRSLISIPAGFAGMNFPEFLLYTAIGASIWTTLLALAGKVLENNYEKVDAYLGPAAYVIVGGLVVWFIIRTIRQNRQARGLA